MPVFISYSRSDSEFVDQLAMQLVANRVSVWMDRWELRVGDSIVNKLQSALIEASALLVILSKESVKSDWCNKELNSGIMREMNEKRVIVLPVLIEDCTIPMFLQEKLYADFRKDHDAGLRSVLEALAPIITEWQGRIENPKWHTDYSFSWGDFNGRAAFEITMIETAQERPYSVLASIQIISDPLADYAFSRAPKSVKEGFRAKLVDFLADQMEGDPDMDFRMSDETPLTRILEMGLPEFPGTFRVQVTCRWLGNNHGGDVFYSLGTQLAAIRDRIKAVNRQPSQKATPPGKVTAKPVKPKPKLKTKSAPKKKPTRPKK